MSIFRIESNHLRIAEEVREKFTVVHDKYGEGIAYSSDTLVVFNDERGTKTFDISPDTFKWLIGEFFIYRKFLYHNLYKLGRIDLEALRGYTELYAWDNKAVFYLNGKVENADPATFQDLGHYWARDAQNVFFQHRQIKEADAATLRVINDTYAADQNHIYGFLGRILADYQEDPRSLGQGYYVINGRIFYFDRLVPDADLSTFKVLPSFKDEEKRKIWTSGGPKDEDEGLGLAGFTARDARHKYKGDWHAK